MKKTETMKDWLEKEPFTLVLSCGFFAFFSHSGVLCALEDHGIVPSKISGCSAGAIVGASWASGRSAYDIRDNFFDMNHGSFMDPSLGLGLLKGQKLDDSFRNIMVDDFSECNIPIQVVALDILKVRPVAITEGDLPSAVRASCAVPGMFQPVRHGDRWFFDGALRDRIGLTGVEEDERMFAHFINFDFYNLDYELQPMRERDSETAKMMLIKDMPGVNIFQLDKGRMTWQIAYDKTVELLNQPVFNGNVAEIEQGIHKVNPYSRAQKVPSETLAG